MKKQLLALSMIATSSLMAQDAPGHYQQNQQSCCDTACSPCCSNPRPCVDCECYVPSFHNLQCDSGFYFDVEFLYWYARETNTAYAQTIGNINLVADDTATDPTQVTVPTGLATLNEKWNPGVRVGIGWNTACDGWDMYLNWTWLKSSSKQLIIVPDPMTAGDPFLGDNIESADAEAIKFRYAAGLIQDGAGSSIDDSEIIYTEAAAEWTNRLNQIDLVLGKKFWMSRKFAFRPFAGLRGAWTKTKLITAADRNVNYVNQFNTQHDIFWGSEAIFRDKIWSVGVVGGIEPTFYFSDCFALYGNLGFSVGWGRFGEKKTRGAIYEDTDYSTLATTTSTDYENSFTYNFYTMSSILDIGLGLRWERTWCDCRFRSAFDLGWEHHTWNNHSFRFDADVPSYIVSDLGFGGLVVRLRVDF